MLSFDVSAGMPVAVQAYTASFPPLSGQAHLAGSDHEQGIHPGALVLHNALQLGPRGQHRRVQLQTGPLSRPKVQNRVRRGLVCEQAARRPLEWQHSGLGQGHLEPLHAQDQHGSDMQTCWSEGAPEDCGMLTVRAPMQSSSRNERQMQAECMAAAFRLGDCCSAAHQHMHAAIMSVAVAVLRTGEHLRSAMLSARQTFEQQ